MTKGSNNSKRQAILEQIDNASEPSLMSKQEAKEWLEEIVNDIESRIECLKEEIANEQ